MKTYWKKKKINLPAEFVIFFEKVSIILYFMTGISSRIGF